MSSEHIYRDFSNHTHSTIRPNYEYCAVEIFSYDHQYTRIYHSNNSSGLTTLNAKTVSHRHLSCYESTNTDDFEITVKYNCQEIGDYRIDFLYENKDSQDHLGQFQDQELVFDGEKNIFKRKTLFIEMNETQSYDYKFTLPSNIYFIGIIIRKIKVYTGDNIDSVGTNLELTECEVSATSMTDPAEATFTIGYSQFFDCNLSRSGVYMDYMDEVNIYFRPSDTYAETPVRRFGGYVSSVKLDDERTKLEFSCGDRLQDGENKYILDSLLILNGTASEKDMEYYNPINFNSYGEALKYVCDVFEVTLDSNISKNYLVQGEKYSTGLSIKFGKKKDITKVSVSNCKATINNKYITVRNNPKGTSKQSILLYDGKSNSKSPIDISEHLTFHMTYGLGAKKTSSQSTTTDTEDSENSAGSQKFGKCGVSADGNYVMGIGKVSGSASYAKKQGFNTTNIYKSIFKNKCPHCGKATLRWDRGTKGTKCIYCGGYNGSKRTWGNISETEISCNNCCADYDAVTGREKDSPYKKLTVVKKGVLSSKAEQDKLASGKMSAVAKSGVSVSPSAVLKEIATIAKKYTYERGTKGQTYSQMKKSGHGDCWGFSDLIFTELKKRKVKCRIYDYNTNSSAHHRVVMYMNANNQWAKFPYQKYNVYPKQLGFTSNFNMSKLTPYKENKVGGNIASVKSSSSSSTTTSTVTTTKGFDKDKPYQAYIRIVYSTEQSWNAKTKNLYLDFTQKANSNNTLSGLSTVWVNNATRKTSVDMKNFFKDNEYNSKIYLHQIYFETPKIKVDEETEEGKKDTNWYTFDKSTQDYSSCKMNLYQIIFDDEKSLNPTDLQSCGKSIGSMLSDLVKDSGYYCYINYGLHRCDDSIHFSIDTDNEIVFYAVEGDDNNILEWTNINYTPVSDLRNKSICVFKQHDGKYAYVDTSNLESMIQYGEKTTLNTNSDSIGSKEAYFIAKNSEEFNPDQSYTYTIIVPYAPVLHIGELVSVVSNYKKLNDVKTIQSIKIKYDISSMPRIQTEIGLDEIEPFLRIKKEQEELRKTARSDKTYFGRTASPIEDQEIYIWDN